MLELGGDADVEHAHPRAHGTGDGVDRRASSAEVLDHRRRHLFRPRRDTAGEHAVVSGADHDRGVLGHRWRGLARHPREADAEVLQAPQAPRRLEETPVQVAGSLRRGRVGWLDLLGQLPYAVLERHG